MGLAKEGKAAVKDGNFRDARIPKEGFRKCAEQDKTTVNKRGTEPIKGKL